MSEHYPLPRTAVYMWLTSEGICVGLPPLDANTKAHTITIPLKNCSVETGESGTTLARQRGWESLLRLLQSRATAPAAPPRLGTASEITQAQLDNALRAHAAHQRALRRSSVEDLGDLMDACLVPNTGADS